MGGPATTAEASSLTAVRGNKAAMPKTNGRRCGVGANRYDPQRQRRQSEAFFKLVTHAAWLPLSIGTASARRKVIGRHIGMTQKEIVSPHTAVSQPWEVSEWFEQVRRVVEEDSECRG